MWKDLQDRTAALKTEPCRLRTLSTHPGEAFGHGRR